MSGRALLCGAAGLFLVVALAAPVAGQSWRTVTNSRRLGDETELDVHLAYGAGRFSVQPAPPDMLYRMQLRYDEETFRPRTNFDGESLRLGVEQTGRGFRFGRRDGGALDVELAPSLPMDLEIEFGAGRADIDLGGLALRSLNLRTGASETVVDVSRPNPETMGRAVLQCGAADFTARRLGNLNARRIEVSAGVGDVTLDLTGAWEQDAEVDVKVGLAALELLLPEGLGVKLEQHAMLASVDTEGLVKRGDAFYSVDWERAEKRIVVRVNAAFGDVNVRWVP